MLARRSFVLASLASSSLLWLPDYLVRAQEAAGGQGPSDDPLAEYGLAWTAAIAWRNVLDLTKQPGNDWDERLAAAQASLAAKGGGVVYFPAGEYKFRDSIKLLNGIVLRGETPKTIRRAKEEGYVLGTRIEFPKYVPKFEGEGTPNDTAFKGISSADPKVSNCGVVHLAVNRGHIHLKLDETFAGGRNRFVVGCIFRNAAMFDPAIPDVKLEQKAWQRYTNRHFAAIDVQAEENILIANNRLPKSGDDDFTMNGYRILDPKKKPTEADGITFDYDNRPAMYINHYSLGGDGGKGPDGTPETHPHAFRKGIVIRDNSIYNSGRMGIGFSGDGVQVLDNVIRFPRDLMRATATGKQLTTGASTNDNRAVEMRGWRWLVKGNDYEVHRNIAADGKYRINDGEGLMHEDHVNSTVRDSVLDGNRGNTYLSIYKTAGINGLLITGNDIRLNDGKQSIAGGHAIFANADRNSGRFECRNVEIVKNITSGGGIIVSGDPAEKITIAGNKHVGMGEAPITNKCGGAMKISGNENFKVET